MAPVPKPEDIERAIPHTDEAIVYLTAGVLFGEGGDARGMALIVTCATAGALHVQHISLPRLTSSAISDLFDPSDTATIPIRVEQSIHSLGRLGLDAITKALLARGTINKVRFVTYGRLGLFPLPSVYVSLPGGKKRPLSDIFEVTFVPSARAAEIAHAHTQTQRGHLLVAGNPQPLPQGVKNLHYAAAEAETTYYIARKHGYLPGTIHYLPPQEVTKQNVIEELQRAWYAHLAVHGWYDVDDPGNSRLILAGKEHVPETDRTILLREALDGSINLVGLRLLVLSACQTSVFDVRRAPNEVLGLATGFLQAGAGGVIASLWSVSERATYLLMSRFVELYLDPKAGLSPARALALAQQWLREEATNRVLQDYKPKLLALVLNGLSDTHKMLLDRLHTDAAKLAEKDPDACLYTDPKHWAAFVLTGC
jgi:CHAT domain-containing protein